MDNFDSYIDLLDLGQPPVKAKYPLVADPVVKNEPMYKLQGLDIPQQVSWANQYPEVWNQGQTNSCTAQSVCAVIAYYVKNFNPSRLFQYYNERLLLSQETGSMSIYQNAGVNLRTAVQTYFNNGICAEDLWPFSMNNLFNMPPETCYKAAIKGPNLASIKINTPYAANKDIVKEVLEAISLGQPVIAGINVYPSFESPESAKTGIIEMPSGRKSALGGHAIVLVGYDTTKQMFIFRNSWGSLWGRSGYGFLPFGYLNSCCLSLWTFSKNLNITSTESNVGSIT